jgi:hypothetical protein
MPDRPEYNGPVEEDTLISTPSDDANLRIELLTGTLYEVKAIEIGPTNGPLACAICVRVPSDWLIDCGPADIVCPQCATAIARAVINRGEGEALARYRKGLVSIDEAASIAGISVEDVKSLTDPVEA